MGKRGAAVSFFITLAYSLGTAIPMLLLIYGGQNALKKVPWLTANTSKIQRGFGLVMILMALAIYFNYDRQIQTYLLGKFPNYGTGLIKLEKYGMPYLAVISKILLATGESHLKSLVIL